MISSPITMLAAREHQRDLYDSARRQRTADAHADQTPVTRVTLRYAAAADAERLRRLAELDLAQAPTGGALVAWRAAVLRGRAARRHRC